MYIIALSNMLEELVKLFKTIGLASNLYQGQPIIQPFPSPLVSRTLNLQLTRLHFFFASNRTKAIGFWTIVNIMTDSLLTSAFILRVVGIASSSDEATARFRLLSFQTLSVAAPLLWMKIITIFDGWKVVGECSSARFSSPFLCSFRSLIESPFLLTVTSLALSHRNDAGDRLEDASRVPRLLHLARK